MKHHALVLSTKPDPTNYTKAVEAFWHTPVAKLFDQKFDAGTNPQGISFVATFAKRNGRMEMTLTPEERMGEAGVVRHTHLRRSFWMDRAMALRS